MVRDVAHNPGVLAEAHHARLTPTRRRRRMHTQEVPPSSHLCLVPPQRTREALGILHAVAGLPPHACVCSSHPRCESRTTCLAGAQSQDTDAPAILRRHSARSAASKKFQGRPSPPILKTNVDPAPNLRCGSQLGPWVTLAGLYNSTTLTFASPSAAQWQTSISYRLVDSFATASGNSQTWQ